MQGKNTVKYNFLYSILSDICSECIILLNITPLKKL